MSASSPDRAVQETELLAGEYALGTLGAEDRATLIREAAADPGLRDTIEAWERRLAPLARIVPPQAPPAELWPRIEASAWGQDDVARAPPVAAAGPERALPERALGRVRLWQGIAVAGFALAAAIAGVAVLHRPPPPPLLPVAGLLPIGQPEAPFFVVQLLPGGELRVTPVGGLHVAPDRDLELWVLKNGEKVPRPLGVLPVGGVQLAPGSVPKAGAKILVSLEPRGGSPTGLPTGPVLSGGSI